MPDMQEKSFIVPYGSWRMGAHGDPNIYWEPNKLLSLTEDEQRRHNALGGYECIKEFERA